MAFSFGVYLFQLQKRFINMQTFLLYDDVVVVVVPEQKYAELVDVKDLYSQSQKNDWRQ